MKILVSWLREFVDVPVSVRTLADALQGCGFEVAAVDSRPADDAGREDGVVDFEVTTNRPDCLNVLGMAREFATHSGGSLREPAIAARHPGDAAQLPLRVVIEDNEKCPRYAAAVADVRLGPSPAWLAARLEASGVRPISNVVDITNYVMLELGQPLHAFDHALIGGQEIRVRRAQVDERLTTLDGIERKLDSDMLVIADATRAQAVAGVMGGGSSEVSPSTAVVVFESAYFQPVSVRRTARRLGLSTEASYRFERGANVQMPTLALGRVAALLEATGTGRMRPGVIDVYPAPRLPLRVLLRHDRLGRVLGFQVETADVERVLTGLGFQLERLDAPTLTWQATVPPWRVDVARETDLIEEVARHVGYDRLPATFPPLLAAAARPDARLARERVARRVALASGFSESLTFTFIERAAALRFVAETDLVGLANPLSEKYNVMRPSLLPGLIDSVSHNRRRERRDVQLFELGARMTASGGETRGIAFAWTGLSAAEHWSDTPPVVDFYDMKGVVESVASALGVSLIFAPLTHTSYQAGRAAAIHVDGDAGAIPVGSIGQVASSVAQAHGLPAHDVLLVAELDLDALSPFVDAGEDVRVQPLPRHPSVIRDISVLLPLEASADGLRRTIRANAPATLERVYEFARYEGKGVPEGHMSLSFRLVFRAADRTLTDSEVQDAADGVLAALSSAHGARLR
ncbi:MAG: phenylalanine--tRNA ligase subunit beta [Vicinamibacterales bacterium]